MGEGAGGGRHRERPTDRKTETKRDRETETDRARQRKRDRDGQTDRQTETKTKTDRQTDRVKHGHSSGPEIEPQLQKTLRLQ